MREVLIFFFDSKKTPAEAHRELQKVYGDAALGETTCRDSFRRFKDGDFDVDDRPREGRPETVRLFQSMAHGLADQQFRSSEEIEKWLGSWIASKDEHFYRNDIRGLPERWAKVVANDGQYLE